MRVLRRKLGGGASGPSQARVVQVSRSTNQALAVANAWTKVTFDTTVFDAQADFDLVADQFKPKIPGWWEVFFQGNELVDVSGASTLLIGYGMNGGGQQILDAQHVTSVGALNPEDILRGGDYFQFNGSTDYMEFFYYATVAQGNLQSARVRARYLGTV